MSSFFKTNRSHSSTCCLAFTTAFGVPGGKSTQSFLPCTTVFQADVANGSVCTQVPLRLGPRSIHRYGGRRRSPTNENKSW